MATQGLTDLEAVDRNDGRVTKRQVERPRVPVDEWMNSLEPGDAWLRVAPIDKGWRQVRVRVALPQTPAVRDSGTALGKRDGHHSGNGAQVVPEDDFEGAPYPAMPTAPRALPPLPPDCPAELLAKMGADILAKVERRWPKRHHELGPCLVWTGALQQSAAGNLSRICGAAQALCRNGGCNGRSARNRRRTGGGVSDAQMRTWSTRMLGQLLKSWRPIVERGNAPRGVIRDTRSLCRVLVEREFVDAPTPPPPTS